MIDPIEADIGRAAVYRARAGAPPEEGVISSFNDSYVFVRYGLGGSQATARRDLEWVRPADSTPALPCIAGGAS